MMRGTLTRLACSLCNSCAVKQNSQLSLSAVQSAKLFVGGISPFMRSEALREAFEPFGEVEEAIKSLHGTRVADAERVTVQHSKASLIGRRPSIVLDNLPPDASASELKDALSQFGKVLELWPKEGFTFALFDSPESAEKAIEGIAQDARIGPFSSVRSSIVLVRMNALFVTNLTEDVSILVLKESLERFGRVIEIAKFTNLAFINMRSPEAAMQAMRALYGTRIGQATNIAVVPSGPRRKVSASGKPHIRAFFVEGRQAAAGEARPPRQVVQHVVG